MTNSFQLSAPFHPTGDQPHAIKQLTQGLGENKAHQVLLGVTGSGKTFTVANVIQNVQKPTLVIAHNKTLAAQLYQEFRDFFPSNAVSYFVSYYDYYQPEAYVPTTDTYIEKEATINDEIDKLRLAATTNLLTRPDTIVIASVSCIYNLGSPIEYGRYLLQIVEGEIIARETLLLKLTDLQYQHSTTDLHRGSFRLRGDTIQLWPAYEDRALNIDTLENKITKIEWVDPTSGTPTDQRENTKSSQNNNKKRFVIYPAKHYLINPTQQKNSLHQIEVDLEERLKSLKNQGKDIEAYRINQRVRYDVEMMSEFGFVGGIENYSRYFDGRKEGEPPFTLLDYFDESAKRFGTGSFLTVVDESHITLPQTRGMYHGDRSRKKTLIEYGFRLPSALDNRPLQFHEFLERNPQIIHISATPGDWELSQAQQQSGESENVVEQLIRPTGLVDPLIELRPVKNQIEDLVIEIIKRKTNGQRTLVTTLTKKMSEALTEYLNNPEKIDLLITNFEQKHTQQEANPNADQAIQATEELPLDSLPIGPINTAYYTKTSKNKNWRSRRGPLGANSYYPKTAYLHSDIETLERSDILADLRRGVYDVVVGINLLREGLDLPEVTLVAILDADKEGFLRSSTSLIQTMGRAARHVDGRAILYADKFTKSMKAAITEIQRRRRIQVAYNLKHNITPLTINKPIRERMVEESEEDEEELHSLNPLIIHLNKREKLDLNRVDPEALTPTDKAKLAKKLTRRMQQAAKEMDFELAAVLRDLVGELS